MLTYYDFYSISSLDFQYVFTGDSIRESMGSGKKEGLEKGIQRFKFCHSLNLRTMAVTYWIYHGPLEWAYFRNNY